MNSENSNSPSATASDSAEAEMARYGISKVVVDTYRYKTFRYTNLNDAVAQAKRDASK